MAANKNNKALNVPHLRFPEFSGEWVTKSINDLAVVIGGGTPDTTVKSYWDGEIQWFTPSEIGKNKYVDSSLRTITEEGLNNSSAKLLSPNTILLSSRATIGECSLSLRECATNQGFQSLVSKKCNVDFLYYLIQTKKKDLIRKSCGSTFLEISANEVRKIQVSVPSDVEQQKIAELLSLIDERIATQNKLIEKLETLIKGIVDFIFTYYKFTTIPFKDVYSCAGEGGTPATSNPEYYKSGTIPFIKIDDLQNKYIESNKDYITELGLQKSSAWIVPTNSIIYSNGATIGKVSINKYPVCTKQGILGIAPKANMNVEFLYYFMTSTMFAKAIERVVTEGTMRTAYLKDINHILCPIPNSNEQNKIAKLLSALSAKLENEIIFQRKLQKQKEFLLSQMFI